MTMTTLIKELGVSIAEAFACALIVTAPITSLASNRRITSNMTHVPERIELVQGAPQAADVRGVNDF